MTTRTRSAASSGASGTASPRKLKQQKVWDVTPSEFSQLCANPIRKIVDNIKKPENADKALIPLSLGAACVYFSMRWLHGARIGAVGTPICLPERLTDSSDMAGYYCWDQATRPCSATSSAQTCSSSRSCAMSGTALASPLPSAFFVISTTTSVLTQWATALLLVCMQLDEAQWLHPLGRYGRSARSHCEEVRLRERAADERGALCF